MLSQPFRYSYIDAKVRTIYAQRLKKSDWRVLDSCNDQSCFMQYLSTTYYGRWLEIISKKKEGTWSLGPSLYLALFNDYHKIARALGKAPAQIFQGLFSRFEAENIKILLRAKKVGLSRNNVSHLLYPVERFSRIQWDKLWKASGVDGTLEILLSTYFGTAIGHAKPQLEHHGKLFPVEMAVEIATYRRIWLAVSTLSSKKDRNMARMLIGSFIDAMNVYHVARLRFIYGLSPEEALNYSYPGGYHFNLRSLHNLCRAQHMSDFIKAMPSEMSTVFSGNENVTDLQPRLQNWVLLRLKRAFLGLPFHLGVEIAWVLYREMEIDSLIRLYESKRVKDRNRMGRLIPEMFLQED